MSLSGGIDSSLVSAIAIDLGEAPLPAYSGVLPKAAKDGDSECVRLLLEKLNLIDRSLETTAQSNYYPQLNKSLERIGEPFDASMFQSYLLYIRASGDGCDYVLDGVDGDIPHSLPSSYPLWIAKQDGIVDALTEVYWIWRRWYDRDQSLPALYLPHEVAWRTSDDDNGSDFILRWATDQQNLLRDKVDSSIDQVGPYGFRMTKDSEDVSNQWTTFCLVS